MGLIFMALSGAMLLTMSIGRLPVLALGLAATFSLYGLFRKLAPVDAVIGLAAETAILFPIGLGGILTLGGGGFISGIETGLSAWVAASGVITIVPLLLFIASSRRIPLVLIGFFNTCRQRSNSFWRCSCFVKIGITQGFMVIC